VSHPSLLKCCRDPGESAGRVLVGVGEGAVTVVVKTGGMMQPADDDDDGLGMGMEIWTVALELALIRAEEGAVVGDAEFDEEALLI
jgi:hypothetical protein